MIPDAEKVLIYARRGSRVLVFDEPDFPEAPLQVPGGTLEHAEIPIEAAKREFHEETGLHLNEGWSALGNIDYSFRKNGALLCHRRHIFTVPMPEDAPENWFHTEEHASDGGGPIRFRLFFLDWKDAAGNIGLGMEMPLSWPALTAFFT
ncbi:NUDIX domain-containing protein [uncultured Martelella sp.]|uniref:NUDIX domain-containing protein n=1 Tax=uncultured Martelella sp. TaxID=392331 RepID=UPI0029C6D7F7|nr:NUDIX domain-containing protein [uncultured Martelella sp.]